jgi:hypothetical protein
MHLDPRCGRRRGTPLASLKIWTRLSLKKLLDANTLSIMGLSDYASRRVEVKAPWDAARPRLLRSRRPPAV